MKSRFSKTKTPEIATLATATKAPRKRISLHPIKRLAQRVMPSVEVVSTFATVFSPEEIHQLIEKKAYEIFEHRGYVHGHDLDDWLEAERIVSLEISIV